ncbi:MAG: PAS domain-containing protein [Desulfobulbus sp.]
MKQENGAVPAQPAKVFAIAAVAGFLLAVLLWTIDGLFEFLWLHNATGNLWPLLFPFDNPHELLMRIIFSSVLIFSGIVVGKTLQRLTRLHQNTEQIAENLRITLNSIGDAVIATDTDGCVSRMNPIAETLTGWTTEDGQGKPLLEVFNIINAQTREPAFNPVGHVLATGNTVGLANHTVLIAKGGEEYQIADSAAPIRGSDGVTTGVVLVFRDVTEEYRMRDEMAQTHTLLRAVVEQSHIPMLMATAPDSCIRLVNQACLDFLGVPNEQYLNRCLHTIEWSWKCSTPDGRVLGHEEMPIIRALRGEATHGMELIVEDQHGNIRHTLVEGGPIRNSEGELIAGLVVFPDITDRRMIEEERKKLQKLESIGTLAGGIAHDFNNILMGVFGGIELAKLTLPKEHESYKYIDTAHQALDRATHLTKQLLTFAKGGEPLFETFRLQRLVRDAVQLNLSGSNVKAEIHLASDLWPIRADRGQISHVLANLIINAKQAMPDGGGLFITGDNYSAGSDNSLMLEGNFVKINLRDEGVGISEKFIERIFDPYFSTKQSGSGLGLAIVHSVITKHNGQIRVESTPDVGTTVTLYLPADDQGECPQETWKAAVVADPGKKGRVLVMDDEVMVREIAGEMLQLLGYEVVGVEDGTKALEAYRNAQTQKKPFCCVIMDLTIPGQMGGKEGVRRLLEIDPTAKVVVASGYSTDPIMTAYEDYGFKGRLAKPFQLQGLRQELTRVLG